MLIWSKQNETQLERLEYLISVIATQSGIKKESAIAEMKAILKNGTLDVDRKMEEGRIPLLIEASKWCSPESIRLLLEYGADPSITFQLDRQMGLDKELPGSAKNSEDILLEYRENYVGILKNDLYSMVIKSEILDLLLQVEKCLEVIKGK